MGRALGIALFALGPGLIPASAQWLEAGPFTSTNTIQTPGGKLNSNDLVYGMPSQGDPVYGASNFVLQSSTDPNTYWMATVSGGIWKTIDGGVTWKPTSDHQSRDRRDHDRYRRSHRQDDVCRKRLLQRR